MKYREMHCPNCADTEWTDDPSAEHCKHCGHVLRMLEFSDKLPIDLTISEVVQRMIAGEKLRWTNESGNVGRQLWLGNDLMSCDCGLAIVRMEPWECVDGYRIVDGEDIDGVSYYQLEAM